MAKSVRTITDTRKYAYDELLSELGIPAEGLSEIYITVSKGTNLTGQVVITTKSQQEIT